MPPTGRSSGEARCTRQVTNNTVRYNTYVYWTSPKDKINTGRYRSIPSAAQNHWSLPNDTEYHRSIPNDTKVFRIREHWRNSSLPLNQRTLPLATGQEGGVWRQALLITPRSGSPGGVQTYTSRPTDRLTIDIADRVRPGEIPTNCKPSAPWISSWPSLWGWGAIWGTAEHVPPWRNFKILFQGPKKLLRIEFW